MTFKIQLELPKANPNKFELMPEINRALKFATYYDRKHRNKLIPLVRYSKKFKSFEKIVRREKIYSLKFQSYEKILKRKFLDTKEVAIVVRPSKIFTPYWLLTED